MIQLQEDGDAVGTQFSRLSGDLFGEMATSNWVCRESPARRRMVRRSSENERFSEYDGAPWASGSDATQQRGEAPHLLGP
jgi:hypothetical protein